MKIWTWLDMKTKIIKDLSIADENYIDKSDELAGYVNEALTEAEAEIMAIDEDYFKTRTFLPLRTGLSAYPLPFNIFANKIRKFMYVNGTTIYNIERLRRRRGIENTYFVQPSDWYQYDLVNHVPGQATLELYPPARETAILPSTQGVQPFVPAVLWYIRNCARVPLLGELCNPEIITPDLVDVVDNLINTFAGFSATQGIPQQYAPGAYPGSVAYATGDRVRLTRPDLASTLPSPLSSNRDYWVIALGGGQIQLATSQQNALAGIPVVLTGLNSMTNFTLQPYATQAIQDATIIDIPEFSTFIIQWVKVRCFEKEGDPRMGGAALILADQKKQMVETLTHAVPDDDDQIEMDFSSYYELS